MSYGPQLPASFQKPVLQEEEEEEDDTPTVYGPQIPTARNPTDEAKIPEANSKSPAVIDEEEDEDDSTSMYGPSIPTNFLPKTAEGPELPPSFSDDEDFGPKPISKGDEEREEVLRMYRLAEQKEAEENAKNNESKREEWMTQMPKSLGNFGLGARTFKTGTAVDRDDSWEDAPGAKKKRKTEEPKVAAGIAEADARKAAIVAEKAAGPSLLEIHKKKRNDDAESRGLSEGERRPFDREKDMEVRGLKPGASKETVDRMKEFASRFAPSKNQRFL
ncbi:unnamed protein product [Caenorhabditis angaria]|uniref:DUF3752 domain-containing protein n=1 Tax=Caenorhabditis angaria TaxID=860376 RepID=A0A9P1I5B9_9PELO|nr:unnamed protein product [Caenorhabditis angaria]